MNDITISNSIKEYRKRLRVTQSELARSIGVSRQTIIMMEKGRYAPSLLIAFRISAYFHRPIEDLFRPE